MKRFQAFCTRFNVSSPFPLTEHLMCCYASFLADEGLAPQTIKSYLSALRNMQLSLGLPDPREHSALPMLRRVQAGISRCRLKKGATTNVRLPITSHMLRKIKQSLLSSSDPNRLVLWAIACTAFFGFFRLGELLPASRAAYSPATSLSWGDISVDSHSAPRMVQLHLKQSKYDQAGNGADVVVGVTGADLCPVTAILQYIEARGSIPGPFFLDCTKTPVLKPRFITAIRDTLSAMGYQHLNYAGHSFRIGAATSAAVAGLEDSTIQTLGRWHSAAFLQYIRTPKERLAAASAALAVLP